MRSKGFGDDFCGIVLDRDRMVVVGLTGTRLFRDQNNVGLVYPEEVGMGSMEIRGKGEKIGLYQIPKLVIESRSKTIRPRDGIIVHA